MKHTIATTNNPLEKFISSLHSDNPETQSWFYEAVVGILEDKYLPSFTKADRIAEVFSDLEMKLTYLKEQQQIMQQLRKQLDHAKNNAKAQVAKALKSFGVDKIEGVLVSSITVQPSGENSKMSLEVTDPQALIDTGYFTVSVDEDAVREALSSADRRAEVEDYVRVTIETTEKPETIRINKRRTKSANNPQLEAA